MCVCCLFRRLLVATPPPPHPLFCALSCSFCDKFQKASQTTSRAVQRARDGHDLFLMMQQEVVRYTWQVFQAKLLVKPMEVRVCVREQHKWREPTGLRCNLATAVATIHRSWMIERRKTCRTTPSCMLPSTRTCLVQYSTKW